jgi:hypothetical protein
MSKILSVKKIKFVQYLLEEIDQLFEKVKLQNDEDATNEFLNSKTNISLIIFIYSCLNNQQNFAYNIYNNLYMNNYINNLFNLTDYKGFRDDERIKYGLVIFNTYYYFLYNYTNFSLDRYSIDENYYINQVQLYLYNTENEDGNKIEYEDLPSFEKAFTDNIMNNIVTLKDLKSDLLPSQESIENIDESNLIQYNSSINNILFVCIPDIIDILQEVIENDFIQFYISFKQNIMPYHHDFKNNIQLQNEFIDFFEKDFEKDFFELLIDITNK